MKMSAIILFAIILLAQSSCNNHSSNDTRVMRVDSLVPLQKDPRPAYLVAFDSRPDYVANHFQMPVGPPDGKGYYNAQGFGANSHLGDDWNGTGGGNSDLGDEVFSVAKGYVQQAMHRGPGWGNVVRIIHKMPDSSYVESLYAHLDTMIVEKGQWINVGQHLGDIGNADGAYYAHLHLEIRTEPRRPLGGGYGLSEGYYVDPTVFIGSH
jgi:murein DD-endopeptidase MepM/ murein hydrolase activator NlpD